MNALISRRPVAICLSMGKVGSTSILRALEMTSYRNAVQHVHFLNKFQLNDVIDEHREAGFKILPAHIYASKQISKVLPHIDNERVRFICPVRDPVAFSVSNFFQNPYFFRNEMQSSLDTTSDILSFLASKVLYPQSASMRYWNQWFRVEVVENLGVNMRNVAFSKDRGWEVYQSEDIRVGVIKLEKMNSVFENFSQDLLGVRVKLRERASNERGLRNTMYAKVLEELRVSDDTLDEIYDEDWVKYFYSDSEIEKFKKRWRS
ncbi:MAG: putative capsular polysaccharide synthesis family protein [Pseudomonadota bacterium]